MKYYKYVEDGKTVEIYKVYSNGDWIFYNLNYRKKGWQKEKVDYYELWDKWLSEFSENIRNSFEEITEVQMFAEML